MGKEKIRWGLLGAGVIIDRWIKGAMQVEDMEIAAVASRTNVSFTRDRRGTTMNMIRMMNAIRVIRLKGLQTTSFT